MEVMLNISVGLLTILVILAAYIAWRVTRPVSLPDQLPRKLDSVEEEVRTLPATLQNEARTGRAELREQLGALTDTLDKQFRGMRDEAGSGREKLEQAIQRNAENFSQTQTTRLKETNDAVIALSDRLLADQKQGRDEQKREIADVTNKTTELIETNNKKHDALRDRVADELDKIRVENAKKLEEMRATVDEKLQGTLEKRLGESFRLVSDRLEQVHKGLGEMQTLATGVGDLKRVLTNVKSRGGWGEIQLGTLLEDMLTNDQFAKNVRVRPDSGEVVDFAVRLPGGGAGDEPVWLPIDAKFPHEDYERLLTAQEAGEAEQSERAAAALERAVRNQAKSVCEKYIHPPYTTDFAIIYLPTEGLFAEIIKRPGLTRDLQARYRITVTGHTTLAAFLNSLQMGFRTLAIEKRSSEVWQVLAAAKSEFHKYGQVWEKLGKQLDTAKNTVVEAGKRTRAVERKLRDVESIQVSGPGGLLDSAVPEPAEDQDETETAL